jgi:hypothetical protein
VKDEALEVSAEIGRTLIAVQLVWAAYFGDFDRRLS